MIEIDLKLFGVFILWFIYEARLFYIFNKIINIESKLS